MINDGTNVFAGVEIIGAFISNDNCATWAEFNDGFKDNAGNWYCNHLNIRSFAFSADKMYTGTDCGIWKRDAIIGPPPVANNNKTFRFYPNPAKEHITVEVKNDMSGPGYSIADQSGRIVQTGKITSAISNINVRLLSPGMYVFRFTEGEKQSFKFFKQ